MIAVRVMVKHVTKHINNYLPVEPQICAGARTILLIERPVVNNVSTGHLWRLGQRSHRSRRLLNFPRDSITLQATALRVNSDRLTTRVVACETRIQVNTLECISENTKPHSISSDMSNVQVL